MHANVPDGGAEGVLYSMGGNDGGFSFYVQDGKLTYGYNYVADQRFKIQSDSAIPVGDHVFSFEFTPTGNIVRVSYDTTCTACGTGRVHPISL